MRATWPTVASTLRCAAFALACLAIVGCETTNPYFDAAKPHHRPNGFNNNYIDTFARSRWAYLQWQRDRWLDRPPPSAPGRVPVTNVDLAYLKSTTRDISVTWIGHATALWKVNGLNILTDPVFSHRTSPLTFAGPERDVPLPIQLDELPRIDVVLVTHDHYDHLDRATVVRLNEQKGGPPLFVVPLGVEHWMAGEGILNTRAMDWWHSFEVPAPGGVVTVHFVPVQHWSSRSWGVRNMTLWGGFVVHARIEGGSYSMFFTGDTGYSKDFADIGARFGGFDFSQISVGCYLPRWFMRDQHVNEDEAVRIHLDVKSRFSIGMHWGTFRLCDDPIEAPLDGLPVARAKYGVADADFVLLAIGETRVLKRADDAASPRRQP